MKKAIAIIVLGLLWCNTSFAASFIYHCNFDTQYMDTGDKWKNKNMEFTFSSNENETISIYDHEIKLTYSHKLDIILNDDQIIGMYIEETKKLTTLVIDKFKNFGTYSISYIDGLKHGQYGFGECKN